eukprot:ANDGO_05143.mRNA.1 hypothetical protein
MGTSDGVQNENCKNRVSVSALEEVDQEVEQEKKEKHNGRNRSKRKGASSRGKQRKYGAWYIDPVHWKPHGQGEVWISDKIAKQNVEKQEEAEKKRSAEEEKRIQEFRKLIAGDTPAKERLTEAVLTHGLPKLDAASIGNLKRTDSSGSLLNGDLRRSSIMNWRAEKRSGPVTSEPSFQWTTNPQLRERRQSFTGRMQMLKSMEGESSDENGEDTELLRVDYRTCDSAGLFREFLAEKNLRMTDVVKKIRNRRKPVSK